MTIDINGWSPGASQDQIDKAVGVFERLTSKLSCGFDAVKGLFGGIVLTIDRANCHASFGDAVSYMAETVIEGGVNCFKEIGNIFYDFGWDSVAKIFNELVGIVADIIPHVITGDILSSDSYFCSKQIQVKILDDQHPFYEWDGWAFEGCNAVQGGECVAARHMFALTGELKYSQCEFSVLRTSLTA